MDVLARIEYSLRLQFRMTEIINKESPKGLGLSSGFWEHVEPGAVMLNETIQAFEDGQIDKEELDKKAAGYLSHWREGIREWKGCLS